MLVNFFVKKNKLAILDVLLLNHCLRTFFGKIKHYYLHVAAGQMETTTEHKSYKLIHSVKFQKIKLTLI